MVNLILKYGFGEGLAKGSNIAILLLLPILLNVDNYSKIVLILALEQFLCAAILFSQSSVFTRWYQKSNLKWHVHIESYCNLNVFYSFFIVLFLLLFSNLVLGGFSIPVQDQVLIIFAGLFFSLNELTFNKLRNTENHKSYITFKITNNFIKLVLFLILVYLEFAYQAYIYALLLSSLYTLFRTFKYKEISFKKVKKKNRLKKMIIIFSIPLGAQAILNVSYTFIDRFFIESMLGTVELALYGNSFTIASLFLFFVNIFSIILIPKYYKYYKEGKGREYINKFTIYSVGGVLIYSVFLFSTYDIFIYYYSTIYHTGKWLTILICLGYLMHIFYLRYLYISSCIGFIKLLPVYSLVSLLFNSLLNLFMIPIWGTYGAAISTILSESLLCAFLLYNVRKGNVK